MILDQVFPETLTLTLTQRPIPQSQDDSWSIRDFEFVDYDLFLGLAGAADFEFDGRVHRVEAGTALLVPPRRRLRADKVSAENFDAVAQHFELKHLGADFFDQFRWRPLVRFTRADFVRRLLDAYVDPERRADPGASLVDHALFRTLVLEFARQAWEADEAVSDPHHGFVFRMARELEAGFRSENAVEAALEKAPCSADYARRLFRRQFGLSPARYVTRCRIRTAVDLLMAGASVKEAAHDVGYDDQLYFSRVFTKLQGLAPRSFQTRQGLRP
jgi:AraC-like DNA-binding protein